ncbi:hypothetical protein B0H17DRAFT_1204900 [Mycena rosella]|uniref:Uncharacterized protein n=1 Tax=Mycena rosella TaxID=1033263 RepID=A0AAD7D8G8_MYCRO|nr:hypothetical protein B0H17DRAFT_1204900 [Mycena rosella]
MANHYARNTGPPPPYSSAAPARPQRQVCHGLTKAGGCTASPTTRSGFCSMHQEQGVWLAAEWISAAERRTHAEGRRCCGLTKMTALCRNNPGGNFLFCWRHGEQQGPSGLGPAPGPESPERTILRERFREFDRMRAASDADANGDRRWREEERRRQEARAKAQREEEERRQQQEREQRRERDQGWQRPPPDPGHSEWHQRSYQHQRRNAGERTRQPREEDRRREQQRRDQQQRAQYESDERARREAEEAAREQQDQQRRALILRNHLVESTTFDAATFSTRERNSFARIPWPVFRRADGTVHIGDVTPQNVRDFFDSSKIRKTARELDVILKKTAHRFHPDRFSIYRAIVSSIADLGERNAVIEAAEVVIKTVNALRSGTKDDEGAR